MAAARGQVAAGALEVYFQPGLTVVVLLDQHGPGGRARPVGSFQPVRRGRRVQPADQKGNESQIFGQFVEMCSSDGVPGPTPADENDPQIIQLYKTYIDGIAVPSIDS